MANLVRAEQRDKLLEGDEEAEELARDARVQFNLNTQEPAERQPRKMPTRKPKTSKMTCMLTLEESPPRPHCPTTEDNPQVPGPPSLGPKVFYGLKDTSGGCWIVDNTDTVRRYLDSA
jgi:hypothetical protein